MTDEKPVSTAARKSYALAIIGGRDFTDYNLFKKHVDEYVATAGRPARVISGGARGCDTLAERYATEEKIPFEAIRPKYRKGGGVDRQAPKDRNVLIIQACSRVLAFPTQNSRGTWHAIRVAEQKGKALEVIQIKV